MSDARGFDGESLPWLEAVENEDGPRAISARKMLVGLLLVLLGGAAVAGTMFWLGRQDPAPGGAPELIAKAAVGAVVYGAVAWALNAASVRDQGSRVLKTLQARFAP